MPTSNTGNQKTVITVRITGEIPTPYAERVKHYCIDAKQDIKDFVGDAVKAHIDNLAPEKFPAGKMAAASVASRRELLEIASVPPTPEGQNVQDQTGEATTKTIVCAHCQSKDVRSRGTRRGKHRYQCNDCDKYFSI